MKTVKLVEIEGNTACWWDFPENKTIVCGILNEAEFIIPEGFTVGTDMTGRKHFYDERNGCCEYCEIDTKYSKNNEGDVAIVCTSRWGERVKLERV